jgi:autotransporter-associated beta strand protein
MFTLTPPAPASPRTHPGHARLGLALAAFTLSLTTGTASATLTTIPVQSRAAGVSWAPGYSVPANEGTLNVGILDIYKCSSQLRFDVSSLAGTYTDVNSVTVRVVQASRNAGRATSTMQAYKLLAANTAWTNSYTWGSAWAGGANGATVSGTDYDASLLASVSYSPDNAANTIYNLVITGAAAKALIDQWTTSGQNHGLVLLGLNPGAGLDARMSLSVNASLIVDFTSAAATIHWNGDQDGTWDTSVSNWTKGGAAATYAVGDNVVFDDSATGTTTITNPAEVAPGSFTVDNTTKAYSIGGNAINCATVMTKDGTNVLTLTGANNFGGVVITHGTLTIGGAGQLGGGTYAAAITDNGVFDFGSSASQTLTGVISGTGSLVVSGSGTLTLGANNTFTGGTTVNAGTLSLNTTNLAYNTSQLQGTLTVNSGATLAVSGYPFGFGGGLTQLNVNGGTVTGTGLSTFGLVYNLTGGAINTTGRMDLGGRNSVNGTINSLASATTSVVTASAGVMLRGDTGQTSYTIATEMGSTSSGVDLQLPSIIENAGPCSIVKTGAGTLRLPAGSSHTGTTSVNNGTLIVDGALSNSAVTVAAAATLSGSGSCKSATVNGNLTPAGATLGTLTIDNTLTLGANSKSTFEIQRNVAGPSGVLTQDQVAVHITVHYGGTLEVISTGVTLEVGDRFQLFNSAASDYGSTSFATINLPDVSAAGLNWDLSQLAVDGSIMVVDHVATPVFSPPPGGFIGAQDLVITSDSGSTIYYEFTTNGSIPADPTTASAHGTPDAGSATVHLPTDSVMDIKAFATKSGHADSPVAVAHFVTLTTPTWINVNGGYWTDQVLDAGNWQNSVAASGSGVTADFSTLTLAAPTTINLEGTRTIGNLIFGDVGDAFAWSLITSTGAGLILDTPTTPTITVNNQTATIGMPITGTKGLLKSGNGSLVLMANNPFTGGTTVNGGTLSLGRSNGTFDTSQLQGTLTINSGATLALTGMPFGYGGGLTELNVNGGTVTGFGLGTYGIVFNLTGGSINTTARMDLGGYNSVNGTINSLASATTSVVTASGGVMLRRDSGQTSYTMATEMGTTSSGVDLQLPSITESASPCSIVKAGAGTLKFTGTNTYTGDTVVNAGSLILSSTSGLTFKPTANGISNKLTGTGSVTLDGGFTINLGGATATAGNAWTLVDIDTLTATFGATFYVVGFTETSPGVWTPTSGNSKWTFTTATGKLTYGGDYASWATAHGISGEPATGDFDHDGLSNLMEYALGLEPAVVNGAPGTFTGNLLSFTKGSDAVTNGDLIYAIETSYDLGLTNPWHAVTPTTDNDTIISYQLPADKSKDFARLAVTQKP